MSGTTSIDSLPSDPTVSAGAPVQNVKMEIKEKNVTYDPNVKENDGNTNGMPSVVQQKQMKMGTQLNRMLSTNICCCWSSS